MEDGYTINVAERVGDGWNGKGEYRHLFATRGQSCTSEAQAQRVYGMIKAQFPEPAFSVTVTHWQSRGHSVDWAPMVRNS